MTVTSGTALVDELIDGVHTGDNLVLRADRADVLDTLVARFVDAVPAGVPLVLVNLASAWEGHVREGATVVDLSPAVTDRPSALPADHAVTVRAGADLAEALAVLEAADEAAGEGAAFVFDPLSAAPGRWGPDAPLELFLATCPRLYRRRSLAVWPIRRDLHRPSFLRRLEEVTQVVVDVDGDPGGLEVTVRKADGRRPEVTGRSVAAELTGGDLRAVGPAVTTRQRLGHAIREQRLLRGLSQSEVARRVDISPSALSQVERGVRGPSGDTLVRLWEVLEVPFGPAARTDSGYVLSRRSGRERVRLQDGLDGERVVGSSAGETWLLRFAPGASGDRAPFAVKSTETVVVVRGVVDLHLGGRTETVHEGDALHVERAAITGWANPAPRAAEVVWTLHGA